MKDHPYVLVADRAHQQIIGLCDIRHTAVFGVAIKKQVLSAGGLANNTNRFARADVKSGVLGGNDRTVIGLEFNAKNLELSKQGVEHEMSWQTDATTLSRALIGCQTIHIGKGRPNGSYAGFVCDPSAMPAFDAHSSRAPTVRAAVRQSKSQKLHVVFTTLIYRVFKVFCRDLPAGGAAEAYNTGNKTKNLKAGLIAAEALWAVAVTMSAQSIGRRC